MSHERLGDAFGIALAAAARGDRNVRVVLERDDGFQEIIDPNNLFSSKEEAWPDIERAVLKDVSGCVLDIGCGIGRHSLFLQRQGFDVTGMDTSEACLAHVRAAGLKHSLPLSLDEITKAPGMFDTLLLLGSNIGLFESRANMAHQLRTVLPSVLHPGGRLIATTFDPYQSTNPIHRAYRQTRWTQTEQRGQIRLRIRFGDLVSPWILHLVLSQDELRHIAEEAGWRVMRIVESSEQFAHYAVVLERPSYAPNF